MFEVTRGMIETAWGSRRIVGVTLERLCREVELAGVETRAGGRSGSDFHESCARLVGMLLLSDDRVGY